MVENTVISGTYWAGPGNTINDTNSGAYAITPRADRRGFWIDHIPANSVGVIELSYSSPVTFSSTYPGMSEGGDENQNGLSNYFDYAAGFDPATPGLTASRPGITVAVTGVDYTHTMRSGANDVFIDYEYSTTLAEPWDPLLSADYTLTEVDQTVERRHRSLKLDPAFLAGKPKLFLRHRFLSTAP